MTQLTLLSEMLKQNELLKEDVEHAYGIITILEEKIKKLKADIDYMERHPKRIGVREEE